MLRLRIDLQRATIEVLVDLVEELIEGINSLSNRIEELENKNA